ncbi:uncharacterized protein involved in high-affinity Fe2+ transport [Thermocatellispora tengchongensis]|uniref:Uncharacterized protein involved in high-affinity Fe2+ transport n=1 Tax=Thermocatellispora tengchongensis TaxID=1073253 RepID=A0A840PQP7_9ACTN|nr:hypothetical protein [Thermocatellispora tengchongensis]MBB5140413.1 uncharacterized protein involved in high-affinity Fe2+ transport [Thermocatellispora tengchongensis]
MAADTHEEIPVSDAHDIDNLDLAATAQQMADDAPAGSLDQAAAASVAITCATTRDIGDARSALAGITPDDVRQKAMELFERLASGAGA